MIAAATTLAAGAVRRLLHGWGVPAQRTFLMLATMAVALCWRVGLPAPTILTTAAALVCLWDSWAGSSGWPRRPRATEAKPKYRLQARFLRA